MSARLHQGVESIPLWPDVLVVQKPGHDTAPWSALTRLTGSSPPLRVEGAQESDVLRDINALVERVKGAPKAIHKVVSMEGGGGRER